jgi:hypothetical protein
MCGRTSDRTERHDTSDRGVRASDADRDRTADHLRVQAGEGRLEPDELEERLERAFMAPTLADLDAVTADLPPQAERETAPRRSHAWGVPAPLLIAAVVTLAIVVHPAIWFALFALCWTKPGHARHAPWSHGRMRGHQPGTARL